MDQLKTLANCAQAVVHADQANCQNVFDKIGRASTFIQESNQKSYQHISFLEQVEGQVMAVTGQARATVDDRDELLTSLNEILNQKMGL